MNKLDFAVFVLIGLSVVGAPGLVAQDQTPQPESGADNTPDALTDQQLALLRRDIRAIKKQLIAGNLTLTHDEATKFWQRYEQYSGDIRKISDTRAAIIKEYSDEYGTLTNDQAENHNSPLAPHRHRDGQASPKTCVDLSKDFTGDEKGDFFPTGPAHQHDDCRAADIATSAHAEPAVPPNQLLEMLESSW